MNYSIWLEFEEYADPTDISDGYCNISVNYEDGRTQSFNVWTVECFKENIADILREVEEDGFSTMPDIIVSRLEREHITEVLKQIL